MERERKKEEGDDDEEETSDGEIKINSTQSD